MKKFYLLGLAFYPLTTPAQTTLPEVVVTATRTPQTVSESLAAVTVLTRKDLEKTPALTLPEIFKGIAGLDLISNGGIGQQTSLFMRGTNSDHLLVLVDGVKIGSPTLALAPFQHLPLSQIERIEIIRGPRSSLYGSEAIGGVIQIFTRQGDSKFHTSAGVGSHHTYQINAGVSNIGEKTWYSGQAEYLQSEGFNACQGNLNGGCFTVEPDDDGYENTSLSLHLGTQLAKNLKIEGQVLNLRGNSQYDSRFNNQTDFTQQVLSFQTHYLTSETWDMTFSLGEYHDNQKDFRDANEPDTYNSKRTTFSWQNNLIVAKDQTLTVGYDHQQDKVDSSTRYTLTSRTNDGYFVQYQRQAGTGEILMGMRKEENEQFGTHTTYQTTLGYLLSPSTRWFTSYATAFKAPSFNQLYYPDYGNPHLLPEESTSLEIGLKGSQPHYNWFITTYRTSIEQLITSRYDGERFFADNLNQAKIQGIETSVKWREGNWELNWDGSWLQPKDDTTGKLLPRRAKRTMQVELAETRGPARLGLSFLVQSSRYDDAENTQLLSSYNLLNLTGEYRFNQHWGFRGRLENLLDKEYATVRFYNAPGRTFFISLYYQE